jgi:hypothetical protein
MGELALRKSRTGMAALWPSALWAWLSSGPSHHVTPEVWDRPRAYVQAVVSFRTASSSGWQKHTRIVVGEVCHALIVWFIHLALCKSSYLINQAYIDSLVHESLRCMDVDVAFALLARKVLICCLRFEN